MYFSTLTFYQLLIFFGIGTVKDVKIDTTLDKHMPKVSFQYKDSIYYMEYISLEKCVYWEVKKDDKYVDLKQLNLSEFKQNSPQKYK